MKTLKSILSLVLFSLMAMHLNFAQEAEVAPFEGSITYEVKFTGPNADNLRTNEANNELEIHMKGGNYIINLKGGRYPKTFMYVNQKDIEYSVNVAEKKAFKYSAHTDINRETHQQEPPVAEYADKTAEVNGILCDVYHMRKDKDYFTFFVSNQYQVDLADYEGKKRAKPFFLVNGLDGRIPLKIIRKTPDLTVMTTIKNITSREFSMEQFELPADFEISNRDYRP